MTYEEELELALSTLRREAEAPEENRVVTPDDIWDFLVFRRDQFRKEHSAQTVLENGDA
jgi:hypothetical protein